MDLNALSLLLRTSLAYECIPCKIYFGTEQQLFNHHKQAHSRRLKVTLTPELQLTEDAAYQAAMSSSGSTANEDDHDCQSVLEPKIEPDTPNSTTPNANHESLDSPAGTSVKRQHQPINMAPEAYEPLSKHIKTEPDNTTNIGEFLPDEINAETSNSSQRCLPASLRDIVDQGHYGYNTNVGFHSFSLDELKKFAFQVVAMFKLDVSDSRVTSGEGSQNHRTRNTENDQTMQQESSQGTLSTPSCSKTSEYLGYKASEYLPGCDSIPSEVLFTDLRQLQVQESGREAFDPTKSCYKCGELGHLAWGCPNPRVPGLRVSAKRRGRRKRKKPAESDSV